MAWLMSDEKVQAGEGDLLAAAHRKLGSRSFVVVPVLFKIYSSEY
jgi:hypothetical protein